MSRYTRLPSMLRGERPVLRDPVKVAARAATFKRRVQVRGIDVPWCDGYVFDPARRQEPHNIERRRAYERGLELRADLKRRGRAQREANMIDEERKREAAGIKRTAAILRDRKAEAEDKRRRRAQNRTRNERRGLESRAVIRLTAPTEARVADGSLCVMLAIGTYGKLTGRDESGAFRLCVDGRDYVIAAGDVSPGDYGRLAALWAELGQ